jgi:hypothetical protein
MASRDLTRVLNDRYGCVNPNRYLSEHAVKAYVDQLTSLGPAGLISSSRRCLAMSRKFRGPGPTAAHDAVRWFPHASST